MPEGTIFLLRRAYDTYKYSADEMKLHLLVSEMRKYVDFINKYACKDILTILDYECTHALTLMNELFSSLYSFVVPRHYY